MKFALILNNDTDGVSQPALNLNLHLKKSGHKSKILTLHKAKKNADVIQVKRSLVSRIFLQILSFAQKKRNILFGFDYSTTKYEYIKKYTNDVDIIIIFIFYNIIFNNLLNKLFKEKKIIYFRPFDSELLTGGCHFHIPTKKFQSNCSNCPKFFLPGFAKFQIANQTKKKIIFNRYKPRILAANKFVGKIYKSVFKRSKISTVHIGVSPKRIKVYSKKQARNLLKLKHDEKIILFGAFNLSSKVKGAHLLVDSIKKLEEKVHSKKARKIRLITFGRKNNFYLDTMLIKWTHLGLIKSDKKLNLILRAADVFACPSLYCYGPHVVTEALINKLPVIAYDTGVSQNSIINGKNGYLIPKYNNKLFAKALNKIIFNKNFIFNNRLHARINNSFSIQNETKTIINLAKKDLNKSI